MGQAGTPAASTGSSSFQERFCPGQGLHLPSAVPFCQLEAAPPRNPLAPGGLPGAFQSPGYLHPLGLTSPKRHLLCHVTNTHTTATGPLYLWDKIGQRRRVPGWTSLPAFLENTFTEALGGPPGVVWAACAALGSAVGGGGGGFFCRGRDRFRNLPADPKPAGTRVTWPLKSGASRAGLGGGRGVRPAGSPPPPAR